MRGKRFRGAKKTPRFVRFDYREHTARPRAPNYYIPCRSHECVCALFCDHCVGTREYLVLRGRSRWLKKRSVAVVTLINANFRAAGLAAKHCTKPTAVTVNRGNFLKKKKKKELFEPKRTYIRIVDDFKNRNRGRKKFFRKSNKKKKQRR